MLGLLLEMPLKDYMNLHILVLMQSDKLIVGIEVKMLMNEEKWLTGRKVSLD